MKYEGLVVLVVGGCAGGAMFKHIQGGNHQSFSNIRPEGAINVHMDGSR